MALNFTISNSEEASKFRIRLPSNADWLFGKKQIELKVSFLSPEMATEQYSPLDSIAKMPDSIKIDCKFLTTFSPKPGPKMQQKEL